MSAAALLLGLSVACSDGPTADAPTHTGSFPQPDYGVTYTDYSDADTDTDSDTDADTDADTGGHTGTP